MRTLQVKARRFLALVGRIALAFLIGFRHGCAFGRVIWFEGSLLRQLDAAGQFIGDGSAKGKWHAAAGEAQ